jgi:protein disulfide-isomerase A1
MPKIKNIPHVLKKFITSNNKKYYLRINLNKKHSKNYKMMKQILILTIALLAITVRAAEPVVEDGVLVLTDENFDEQVAKNQFLLVEFYAPWCGHCKKLTPEYAAAAQELSGEVALGKVDATEHKQCGEKFNISGFPTLKFFTNGVASDYEGGRTHAEIVQWLRKKTGPSTKEFTTMESVEAFKASADAVVMLFGETGLDNYKSFTSTFDDVSFGHCVVAECMDAAVENGTVVVFKNFDEGRNELKTGYTREQFTDFVNASVTPVIMKFDEKCAQHIFGKAKPGLFLYMDKNASNAAELTKVFTDVAPEVRDRIQLVSTGITEGLETRLAEYIGITADMLPSVRIHDTRGDLKKFNMEGEINTENVLNFVNQWSAGTLAASLKSEEIPATQSKAVHYLVGKAFDAVVMDPTKDVLVKFYAPWCGHCKTMAPIYEELAEKLKHNTNLVIAEMDSTLNETERVSIQGFPTLKFWPAGNKDSPMEYEGERDLAGFEAYLTKNCVNPLTPNQDL